MKIDQVCKMGVDEQGTVILENDGNTYHFCCPSCKAICGKTPQSSAYSIWHLRFIT